MAPPFLELDQIVKTYPGVRALKGVSLTVARGEVVGLIGENGAGKSTLMKVLGGVVAPTQGTIRVEGRVRVPYGVKDAFAAGVAFVHQELNLLDNFDVAANVFLGREPLRGGPLRLVDTAAIRARVAPLIERLGADFRPDTPVADLSLAQRQLVEIAKALSIDAKLLILDEPTSSLTLAETQRLLGVIADLARDGVGVVFISHRLAEVTAACDRVVVLRDGVVVGGLPKGAITHEAMIRLMIGRELKSVYQPPQASPGGVALSIQGLRTRAHPDVAVDLDVRHGEILCLAGLVGAGRTEVARAVFGVDTAHAGTFSLDDHRLDIRAPHDAIRSGIYLVPEDRKRSGLILEEPIVDNVTLADLPAFASVHLVSRARERACAERQRASLDIRTPSVEVGVDTLSGGNQQKVVLAKWLSMAPKVMILDEPTRGVDVGGKAEIYRLMRALADEGIAVLMISSDMEEVIGVSDRVCVMHEGRVSGFLARDALSEANILTLAVGDTSSGAPRPC